MPTFKSSIKIPLYPQHRDSFNRRLGGFFRECWQRMRVMHAEFEHGELCDRARFPEVAKSDATASQVSATDLGNKFDL
jgi:hypothetical protein